MPIIGIDLGTWNSAAAALRGGRPIIISSAEGITPAARPFSSYVALTADGQIIVGGQIVHSQRKGGGRMLRVPGTSPGLPPGNL